MDTSSSSSSSSSVSLDDDGSDFSSHLDLVFVAGAMKEHHSNNTANINWIQFLRSRKLMNEKQLEKHAKWIRGQADKLERERLLEEEDDEDSNTGAGDDESEKESKNMDDILSMVSQVFGIEELEWEDSKEEQDDEEEEEEEEDDASIKRKREQLQYEEDENYASGPGSEKRRERKPRKKKEKTEDRKLRRRIQKNPLKATSRNPTDLPLNLCVDCEKSIKSVQCLFGCCRSCCKKKDSFCKYHKERQSCVNCTRQAKSSCLFKMCAWCCRESSSICEAHKATGPTQQGLKMVDKGDAFHAVSKLWTFYANGEFWNAREILKELLRTERYNQKNAPCDPYVIVSFCVGLAKKKGSRKQLLNMLESGFRWLKQIQDRTRKGKKSQWIDSSIDVLFEWESEKIKHDQCRPEELESLMQSFPDNARLYFLLGYEYELIGDVEKAKSNYEVAWDIDNDIEAIFALIRVLGGPRERAAQRKIQEALQVHSRYYPLLILYREAKPNDVKAHLKVLELDKTNELSLQWLSAKSERYLKYQRQAAEAFANVLIYKRDFDSVHWDHLISCLEAFGTLGRNEPIPSYWQFFISEMILAVPEAQWTLRQTACYDMFLKLRYV